MFRELMSPDHEDGRATTSTIAEFGFRNAELKFTEKLERIREPSAKSELLTLISSHHKSEILNRKSKIAAEAYLDGTSQGAIPEDGHIQGRSKRFM
jgi:hypothetical protein